MLETRRFRAPVLIVAFVLALGVATIAKADGEVGLVVQDGDQVKTYCVGYSGDGITGQNLLKTAGFSIDAFGGSALAVCALGSTGCKDASSYTSCFCQCQGGDCTYWAFFTRQYGKGWVYSTLAFNLIKAKDGDVHGWKWGKGAANSAPAPQDISFEQICGHSPQGGASPPTSTLAAANTPTAVLPTGAGTAAAVTTQPPGNSASAAATENTPAATVTPSVVPTVTISIATTQASAGSTPQAPASGVVDRGEGSNRSYVAAGAVIALLLAAIGGALIWRRRNGV